MNLLKVFTPSVVMEMLGQVEMRHVERLGYVTDAPEGEMGIDSSGKSLTILIYLKPGCTLYPKVDRLDVMQFTPLGYHEPAEFYQPRYEVEKERTNPEPDERPTLYWNPTVRLAPGQPQVLKFYTSDREGPFRVVLEGVTEKGEVVRVTKSLSHKAGRSDSVIKL